MNLNKRFFPFRSNCIPKVQNILRKHYSRPAFLPDDSESSSLDWIFMGGSGNGALMHVCAPHFYKRSISLERFFKQLF